MGRVCIPTPLQESQEEGVAEGEGVPDDEDYKSAEDNLTPANETDGLRGYESTTPTSTTAVTMENTYIPPTDVMPNQQEPASVVQSSMIM